MTDEMELPRRPFFSCEEAAFSIVDAEAMRQGLMTGGITPAVTLQVGPDNIFEHRPRKVLEHQEMQVSVQCDGDISVHLDFHSGTAYKRSPDGEFLYRGGIEEGNDGKGFIRTH